MNDAIFNTKPIIFLQTLLIACFLKNCLVHKDMEVFMMLLETVLLLFLSSFFPNEDPEKPGLLILLICTAQGPIWLSYLLLVSQKKRNKDDIKQPFLFLTPLFFKSK